MKKDKLKEEQELKIAEYREKYFRQSVSTEPADRNRAETAARRLAEIGGVTPADVIWVSSPEDVDSISDSIRDPLWDSIRYSLRHSLWDSISDSIRDLLRDSLRDSIRYSLWDSIWDSIRYSIRYSLRYSLWDSIWYSLWDTGWLAYYSYVGYVLGVELDERTCELLNLYNEIAASCFALWISPGTIIMCERPAEVEIVAGHLVSLKWRIE